jgi:two-component system, LytTR family, sensor kinase
MTPMSSTRRGFSSRELALIFVFWTSLATLSTVNRLLDPRGPFGFHVVSPAGPIALAYIEAWIWAAVTPLVFSLTSRFSLERSRWLMRILLLIGAGIVISIAVFFLLDAARDLVFNEVPRRGPRSAFSPLAEIGRFRFLNQLLVYLAVVAAGYAREYFLRGAELRAQLAEARLDALRAQLNPHFLFNTLHAISALVERDPAGVRRMIARLSELLRHTIDARGADEVPLRDELAFLRRYVDIMEVRFQGRLRVETEIDDETLDALVPNLILQPIVENALEHGAARAEGEGRISIAAHRDGAQLVLIVRDNGPGVDKSAPGGVGLANTRARLSELYGERGEVVLSSPAGGGAVAELELPFHTAEVAHAHRGG